MGQGGIDIYALFLNEFKKGKKILQNY